MARQGPAAQSGGVTDEGLVSTLGRIDIFAPLSPRVLRRIVEAGQIRDFPHGTVVTAEGESVGGWRAFSERGVEMHVVLAGSGDVTVHGTPHGAVAAGEYFGELSLIDGLPRSATVRVGAEGMRTFALSKWSFVTILEEHPEVALPLLRVLCARLRASEAVQSPTG